MNKKLKRKCCGNCVYYSPPCWNNYYKHDCLKQYYIQADDDLKINKIYCDDFECKFFEEDKTMTYEIKKNMDSGNYELYFNNSLIVSVNGIGPKEKLMVNRIKKLLEEK